MDTVQLLQNKTKSVEVFKKKLRKNSNPKTSNSKKSNAKTFKASTIAKKN